MADIAVYKSGYGDWEMTCDRHDEFVVAGTWADAYEAALGHAVMWHDRPAIPPEFLEPCS